MEGLPNEWRFLNKEIIYTRATNSISWKCSAEEGAVGDDDAPIDEGIAGHLFLSLLFIS